MTTQRVVVCDLCSVPSVPVTTEPITELREYLRANGWVRYGNALLPAAARFDACERCAPLVEARPALYTVNGNLIHDMLGRLFASTEGVTR